MQRVIDTLQEHIDELKKALPPAEECLLELRANMLQSISDHETVLSLVRNMLKPAPLEVLRYHRLAAVQQAGYGEIVKHNPEHWAYKYLEGVDAHSCSNEMLHNNARKFAEFEAAGQVIAYSIGYSGGFYDGKHNSSAHADNPYAAKEKE